MKHILEADGIQLSFNGRSVLSDIYLQIETGRITGLLGRNGQGKTCLLQAIHGSLNCERSVRINRRSVRLPVEGFNRIKYLPQFHFIPGSCTIKRVLADYTLSESSFVQAFPEYTEKLTTAVKQLSGGERRLIELYIVLRSNAPFILLDEPFTMLSPLQIDQVISLIEEEKEEKGILMTDHLYEYVINHCEQLYVLSGGKMHMVKTDEDIERLGYYNATDIGYPLL
jgi:ABC-type multidrug transport system ATPase subunit